VNDTTLRSVILVAESIVFTVLVPGTVTVWLPWILLDGAEASRVPWSVQQYAALPVVAVGVLTYSWCLGQFVVSGRGIPAPIDHARQLVVRGLYRYVRNPMYLAVLSVLIGEVIFLGSRALLLYTITWFGIVHGVVVLYEEPALRTKFGAEYERYAGSVHRWLPAGQHSAGDHMTNFHWTFGALVLAQAAHSVEEFVGRLWESFPPARFLSSLISSDLRVGFLVINVSFVMFGLWCFFWPVRRRWQIAAGLAWVWVVIEVINGIGHPLWALRELGYTPGVITAPLLLILALYMAAQLRSAKQTAA